MRTFIQSMAWRSVAFILATIAAPTFSATFVVENVNDADSGSLRQAILDANASMGEDFIGFNIPGFGPHTLSPQSGYPEITEAVTIDGFTQGSQTASPDDDAIPNSNLIDQPINAVYKIELDGINVFNSSGLTISGSGVTIRGLVIGRFRHNGILIQGGVNISIEGCFIGTSVGGSIGRGNFEDGINLSGAENCRIGGQNPAQRNLISDNDDGIDIQDSSTGILVGGNFIGINASGSQGLGNSQQGVKVENSDDNIIGGSTSQLRNVISGNSLAGVGLIGGSSGNTVQGNYIGATPNGLFSIGNLGEGVEIDNSPNNLIGGTDGVTPGEGCNGACNLICGNNQEGLAIDGTGAVENRVSGNYIGTDQAGTADLGNGFDGILIAVGGDGTFIGGTDPGSGNVIAHSGQDGIALGGDAGTGVSIIGNSIYDNGTLGIDLNNNGLSENDLGSPPDQDTGANNLQNFPVLSSATVQGGETHITGTLESLPESDFRIEFFANSQCDGTNHGEGERFLGFELVSTDSLGAANFAATLPVAASTEAFITATATLRDTPNSHADTSEFSMCLPVVADCLCPSPIPDFVVNGRVDGADLMALLQALHDGEPAINVSGDARITAQDFFQFACCWYDTEMP
ncbi:MAG: right-handed parallel beta-helix repeat-containing protein [Candidatus Omnitrophica bacterium]|nr:right-handed parallel beta-helix repeat-containing protein [Candidatus Omnitrophota bacterium]